MMQKYLDLTEKQFFRFPLSTQGLESFESLDTLTETFNNLIYKYDLTNKGMKWHYRIGNIQHMHLHKKEKIRKLLHLRVQSFWRVCCTICNSSLIYYLQKVTKRMVLAQMNEYHIHTEDINKYIKFLSYTKNEKFLQQLKRVARYQKKRQTAQGVKSSVQTILDFFKTMPNELRQQSKYNIMNRSFGISEKQLQGLANEKIQPQSKMTFKELAALLQIRGYKYSYLPRNLLSTKMQDIQSEHREQMRDTVNPQLPNILIIVDNQMMEEFRNFGHNIGFDLTFSIIKERSDRDGEYMIGVFATFNNMRKITVTGLVITNSQSVFAYSFIFKEYFKIMNSVPKVIVTDEQRAILYALDNLKQSGIFTGTHLLDMFHILRRFRKSDTNSTTRQYFNKLIHAQNKMAYRRIFRQAMQDVSNDKELHLLRNFDLNSERYCYSQIGDHMVGIGVSNSCNEMFHWLMKIQISYAVSYIKAVMKTLQIINEKIIKSRKPEIQIKNYDEVLNMPIMRPLRILFSWKLYNHIFKEINRSYTCRILTSYEVNSLNLRQHGGYEINKDVYYIQNPDGIFKVYRNKSKQSQKEKWYCMCKKEQRAGFLCCHMIKILMKDDQDFLHYIDKSWFIDPEGFKYKHPEMYRLRMQPSMQKRLCEQKPGVLSMGKQQIVRCQDEVGDEQVFYYKLVTNQI